MRRRRGASRPTPDSILEFQVKVTASGLVEKETKRALMRELLRRRFKKIAFKNWKVFADMKNEVKGKLSSNLSVRQIIRCASEINNTN